MPARISQHSLAKKGKPGKAQFLPDLKEWTKVCKIYPYDTDIIKHFDIAKETFYSFIDKQRYEKEQKNKSEYLDAYKNGRAETKQKVLNNLLEMAYKGDNACTIFTSKTYGGLRETKDLDAHEIRIKEYELKEQAFRLSTEKFVNELCEKHNLDKNETLDTLNKHLDSYATRK
jgi:hypothetical protein